MDETTLDERLQVIRCVGELVDQIVAEADVDVSGWPGLFAMYTAGGRRRAVNRHTAEEQVLDRIARDVRLTIALFSDLYSFLAHVHTRTFVTG